MYKFIKELRKEYVVTDEDINEIEEKYDIHLPLVLRDYYLNYNGAKVKKSVFYVDGFEHSVWQMVQIKYGEIPLEEVIENDRMDGFIPKTMIPLAYNEGGDYFYCNLTDGKVYVMYDIIENHIYICDSVSEFFRIMEENICKE